MCQLVKSQGEEGGLQRMQPRDPALKKPVREPTGKPRGCPPGGWPEKPQKKPKGCPPGGWKNKDKVVNGGSDNDE